MRPPPPAALPAAPWEEWPPPAAPLEAWPPPAPPPSDWHVWGWRAASTCAACSSCLLVALICAYLIRAAGSLITTDERSTALSLQECERGNRDECRRAEQHGQTGQIERE